MVVDASVWVSILTPSDAHHLASQQWLAAHLAAGGQVVAPTLLLAEVAGAVARRSGDATLGQQVLNLVLRQPALYLVALDEQLSTNAARLAANLQLRGADAVYVATADSLNIPLVTWDREQLNRAARHVTVWTP